MPEVIIFFFASEASEQRGEAASTRREAPRKNVKSRLPSEPAKRLIFSPTIRQRASGTRVLASLSTFDLLIFKILLSSQQVSRLGNCVVMCTLSETGKVAFFPKTVSACHSWFIPFD